MKESLRKLLILYRKEQGEKNKGLEEAFFDFLPYFERWKREYKIAKPLTFVPEEYSEKTKEIITGLEKKFLK